MTVVQPATQSRRARLQPQGRRKTSLNPELIGTRQRRGWQSGLRQGFIVCHKIGDAGVNFAPNLSPIGSRLTREQIIKSILEPSAEIAKGNESVNVETTDGELYTGLIDEETAGQLKLRIGAGLVQTIPKSSIKMREISKNSGMPVGLEQTMSKQEFVDLVEYLMAQK
jgi:putative heme-binding domain-containing protein